ncbi:siderophore-interacting protein [Tessaracoccus oleiagri]|uniref:NADPH-dependent ferric siderophore reductase, contains FAD-binding and SIP domains n=1 Tax=Tessaracoccus oleiagri TaxID=686624 RepID=A0A1G9MAH6_9ACTN|nr:siderophore-interacting protein [Tessaracoccus oleiagri]SDL71266.1 NADPH-dependent ferric siderophore reductase, contains FAD-binding and SIP domains [Tessaracoccus oleiagri]
MTSRSRTSPTLALAGTVTGVEDLCPTLRRVTLGGPELAHLGVAGPTLDLRLKLVVPDAGADFASVLECLAEVRPDAPGGDDAGWYRRWLAQPEHRRGAMRTYTARELRHTASGTELVVDFVLHLDEVDGELVGGPATLWAARATVGDPVAVVGPNRAVCGADYGGIEWRPGRAREVLLVGDETAVPAVAAICAELARQDDHRTWRGRALLEVPTRADALPIAAPPGLEVAWLPRDGAPRGSLLPAALADAAPPARRLQVAVEDVDLDRTILWETGSGRAAERYAWVAGEAGSLKPLRRWLLGPAGYTRDQVAIMGYWREGMAG